MNRQFADFIKYRSLLYNLIGKEVKLKYRRSVLGIAWSVLNPLFIMIILTQVFGRLLKIETPGYSFAVFFILGNSMWSFYSESTNASLMSIIGSAALIKKVYIPKYIFPLEKCLFALVNFMFSMIAVLIVMIFNQVSPSWTMLLFPVPIVYLLLFNVGISLILSTLTVFFRDIVHIWGIIMTAWMYLTPLLYPMDYVYNTNISWLITIINLNPLTWFINFFRDIMMFQTVPTLMDNLICLAWGIGALFIGLLVFKRTQDQFILHI